MLYIARIYEKLIDSSSIYKQRLIKLPAPEFIVLYNGDANYPEKQILQLSDAFLVDTPIKLELRVKIININYGKSKVLKKSKTLEEYSYFVSLIKQYRANECLENAIQCAVQECLRNKILVDFFRKHGSEVENMLFTEFNLEDAKKVWIQEGREEGREEGSFRAIKIMKLYTKGNSIDEIAAKLNLSTSYVDSIISKFSDEAI